MEQGPKKQKAQGTQGQNTPGTKGPRPKIPKGGPMEQGLEGPRILFVCFNASRQGRIPDLFSRPTPRLHS
jgi:hypothetical protein